MEKFQTDSSCIYFRIVGEGKPLLFLHGFLEDHSIWNSVSDAFVREGFSVILVDLPCHGLSRFDRDFCSMKEMAFVVSEFLKANQISNPFVFGHSMGGYVGLELMHLQSINLTLVNSNFWEDSSEKKLDRNRVIEIVQKNKHHFLSEAIPNLIAPANRERCQLEVDELIKKANQIPANEIIAATGGMRDRRSGYDLFSENQIQIIHGSDDPIIPTSMLESEIRKLSSPLSIIKIENCGHISMLEQPTTLINRIKSIVIE